MALPLDGIRVLDFTRALAGPFCTMILADMGAEVIKIESLPDGDMTRGWGPFDRGVSTFYMSANRNKKSLAVDFRSEPGRRVIQALAREVDVLAENFKPGTTPKMGIDYETLKPDNPKLVYASITGFGTDGPYGAWPGYDQIAQGMSGMMSITGQPDGDPTRMGVPIADLLAGMWSSTGVLAALHQRHATGEGQRVDTNLLAAIAGVLSVQGQRYLSLGDVPGRAGNDHPVLYPYGAFTASDGLVNVAAATQGQWEALCKVLGCEEMIAAPEFLGPNERAANRDELRPKLNEKFLAKTAIAWTEELMAAGIPAGPVYDLAQAFSDPQAQHLNLAETVTHPALGDIEMISNPLRLDALEGRTVRTAPPLLGQHSREILAASGFEDAEVDGWIGDGVVVQSEGTEP